MQHVCTILLLLSNKRYGIHSKMIANTFLVASSHCVFQYFEQMYKMSRVPVVADTYGREAICSSIEPKKSRFLPTAAAKSL